MDGHKDRFGGVGAAVLAAVALGLCCGAPLLIVAAGAIVAAVGWTYLGIGAGLALLAVAGAVALYRYRRAVACKSVTAGRQLDSVHREV
jgi:hypothetical protein